MFAEHVHGGGLDVVRLRQALQDVAELQQERLPPLTRAQFGFRSLPLADVVEDGHNEAPVLVDPREVNVKPAAYVLLIILDPDWLTGPRNLLVAVQPRVLDAGKHFGHRAAYG